MTKSMSFFDKAAEDLSPPFNLYAGRDTSVFALTFDGEEGRSKTSQEFASEADVNVLMARYLKSGTIPVFLDRRMLDGDLHEMSYHEMQNAIADANSSFASLPAEVRSRFDNDPAKFIDFASDEANLGELRKLGMLSPEAVQRLDAAEAAALAKAAEKPPEPSKPAEKASEKPAG